ncbi:hypothetical protein BDA96_07G174100 [Sorghum bicolor]|uniref:Uncharacterized protein n=2 Tax=Sorghum bicolor TaxID=4558 RepID=A0A921UA87_SORBI|nr:hypothetical protein BDA96_07G174100 [Sorghum bicolor]OQU80668.1 hypothetical protein SORBI_3007G162250 [Sorghum bicolor]
MEKKTGVLYTFLFGTPIKSFNLTIICTLLERKAHELENVVSLAICCPFFFPQAHIYFKAWSAMMCGTCRGVRAGS